MSADRFWGRVFRSKYFQGGIGLAERQQTMNDEDASAFVASYVKETVRLLLMQLWQPVCAQNATGHLSEGGRTG